MQQFLNQLTVIGSCLTTFSYSVSGALVVCDIVNHWMQLFDHHAWLAGTVIGLMTLAINVIFNLLTWLTNLVFRIVELAKSGN